MTLFSYGYSAWRKKRYKEPELLNELLVRWRLLNYQTSVNHPAGWIIHYAIGLGFVSAYRIIELVFRIEFIAWHYALAGAVSGLIGILVWSIALKHEPVLTRADQPGYFYQLELAHIIFGLACYPLATLL